MKFWQVSHALCIVAHLGMAIAGFVTFILAGPIGGNRGFSSTSSTGSFRFSSQRSSRPSLEGVILPWATFGVAALSLSSNGLAFIGLVLIEYKRKSRYAQKARSLQTGLTILTYIGNFCLGAADAVLVGFLASRIHRYNILVAPLALAAVSALFAFLTACLYVAHHRTLLQREREQPASENQTQYGSQNPFHNSSSWGYQQPNSGYATTGNQMAYSGPQGYQNQPSWGNQDSQAMNRHQGDFNNQSYDNNLAAK